MAFILIVDDDPNIRRVLSLHLEKEGHALRVASDAEEALWTLSNLEFDLVVTDIFLPRLNGVELLEAIRQVAPHVEVIIMTGEPTVETASEALRLGAADYLMKPISRAALIKSTTRALQFKQLSDEKRRLEADNRTYQQNLERIVEERTRALRESRQQLRGLAGRIENTREEEQKRIAGIIHDEIGQLLTVLKMDLGMLARRAGEIPAVEESVPKMKLLLDQALEVVHHLSHELRPTLLDDLGIVEALNWHLKEFTQRAGVAVHLEIDPPDLTLDRDRSVTLFRVFQEAITNIARHAGASVLRITLRRTRHRILLRIRDDGKGCSPMDLNRHTAFGVLQLRERALRWGGATRIGSLPGQGTVVRFSIPIPNESKPASPSPEKPLSPGEGIPVP